MDRGFDQGPRPGWPHCDRRLAAIAFILLGLSFERFYAAGLPEVANRALFWAMVVPLVLTGAVLNASHTEFLREVGWVIQLLGIVGVVYGVIQLRVVDIRQTIRLSTINFSLTLITAGLIWGVLLIADEIQTDDVDNRRVVLIGLALITAALYGPLYLISQALSARLIRQKWMMLVPKCAVLSRRLPVWWRLMNWPKS